MLRVTRRAFPRVRQEFSADPRGPRPHVRRFPRKDERNDGHGERARSARKSTRILVARPLPAAAERLTAANPSSA